MKKNKIIITEADRQADLIKREKAIVESFGEEFNRIKRVDEDDPDPFADTGGSMNPRANIMLMLEIELNNYASENKLPVTPEYITSVVDGLMERIDFSYDEKELGEVNLNEFINHFIKIGEDMLVGKDRLGFSDIGGDYINVDGSGRDLEGGMKFMSVNENDFDFEKHRSDADRRELDIKSAMVQAVGIDKASKTLELPQGSAVTPFNMITSLIRSNLIGLDEINTEIIDAAIYEAEYMDHPEGEGFGSSDMTYLLGAVLRTAGYDVDYSSGGLVATKPNDTPTQSLDDTPTQSLDEISPGFPTEMNGIQLKSRVTFNVPNVLGDKPEVTSTGVVIEFDSTTIDDYAIIAGDDGKEYSVRVAEIFPIKNEQY